MAYHLIPFVAGAVVGGLAVYLFRDEQLRDALREKTGNLSRRARETAGQDSDKVGRGLKRGRKPVPGDSQGGDTATEVDETVADATAPKARTSRRGRATGKSPTRATARKRTEKNTEAVRPERPEDT